MPRERSGASSTSSSTTTAALLALLLVALVVVSVFFFAKKTWWFPPAITAFGHEVDAQFMRTLVIVGVVFVLSQLALAYAVFRFRDRGQRATHNEGNQTMEVLWTLATIVLFVGLGVMARNAWAEVHFRPAAPDAIQIEVTGQQFAWNFRYSGADGKFGRLNPKLVNASGGNPLGLDPADPDSKDDLVVPVMAVPVNREVELLVRSQDVTHSFFVRELRLKQDAVPGMIIRVHFTATEPGSYEIPCAELCGLGHYRMHSTLTVMSDADYQKWLKEQAAANAP
ncbi:MAG TPA: cytochrome c oxidase subunit II [Candidatus Dormibacteraeota bacterium]|nr:cytochrome c oxidase subunit II [Candidatus Dormibacteraeota bacterium]